MPVARKSELQIYGAKGKNYQNIFEEEDDDLLRDENAMYIDGDIEDDHLFDQSRIMDQSEQNEFEFPNISPNKNRILKRGFAYSCKEETNPFANHCQMDYE